VVGTALAKNPAHRFASFGEMARAVDHVGQPKVEGVPLLAGKQATPSPQYWVEPEAPPALAPVGVRGKLIELSGSLLLAVLVAAICTLGYVMLAITTRSQEPNLAAFASTFYLMVIGSWSVLVPARFWDGRKGDPWLRRGVMLLLGLGMGVLAYWLNGWDLRALLPSSASSPTRMLTADLPGDESLPLRVLFGYLTFYGLSFFLVRWWRLAERNRSRRFSLFAVLGVCVPVWILFGLLWGGRDVHQLGNEMLQSPVALMLTAVVVQMASPWQPPLPRPARRMRLRYA
jgi:eukaryotic-like serine/threonine-protein kinase